MLPMSLVVCVGQHHICTAGKLKWHVIYRNQAKEEVWFQEPPYHLVVGYRFDHFLLLQTGMCFIFSVFWKGVLRPWTL